MLMACTKVMHLTSVQPQTYVLDSGTQDSSMVMLIRPYKDSLDDRMEEVIGHSAAKLLKQKPEGALGSWMCDALVAQTQPRIDARIDFAVMNYGGMRINEIPLGPITVGKIYELMPFDNIIVVLEAKGEVVQQFFDFIAATGGWPVSEAVRFTIRRDKATDITIGGIPFEASKTYRFIVPDFLANGGDNLTFLQTLPRVTTDLLVRDALINEVRQTAAEGKTIEPGVEGRIRVTE